jgi:hypothetical protein
MPIQPLTETEEPPQLRPRLVCRVTERHPCELPSSCQPISGRHWQEAKWPATILDISRGGLRLILQRRFEPGANLDIELPGSGSREASTVIGTVVYVRPQDAGFWSLGCKFASELSEEELRELLGHQPGADQPAQPEPIAAHVPSPTPPRSAGRTTVAQVNLQVEDAAGKVRHCRVKRLSVPPSWPLPAGKTLTMFVQLPGGALRNMRLQVIECLQQEEGWTLRCLLLDGPSCDPARRTDPGTPPAHP